MGVNRVKAQEASWLVSSGGELQDEFTFVQSVNVEFEATIISKGYIGGKSEEKDSIFKGCKGDWMLHTASTQWIKFMKAYIAKMKRTDPTLQINLSTVLFYDDEDLSIIFPNVAMGGLSLTIGNREDYVGKKFTWECKDFDSDEA